MGPEVRQQRDDTAAHNDLIPFTLGLMQVLEKVAVSATTPLAESEKANNGSPEDDELLAALLGALAVRHTLRRWLREAATEPPQDDRRAEPNELRRGSLMR
jgi:hypothetical protein